jgi:hypothetical protein
MVKECFEVFTNANNLAKKVNICYGMAIEEIINNNPNNESITIAINSIPQLKFESGAYAISYECVIVLQSRKAMTLIPKLYEFSETKISNKLYTWDYSDFSFIGSRDETKLTAYSNLRFYV